MSSISSIAQSGMQAAQQRLDTSAHNVANQNTTDFRRHEVQQQERAVQAGVEARSERSQQPVEVAKEMVEQVSASHTYMANLQAMRADDRMRGTLLDERV